MNFNVFNTSFLVSQYVIACLFSNIGSTVYSQHVKVCPCLVFTGPDTLKSVDLSPCTEQPCVFHKGINVTVTIDFTPEAEGKKIIQNLDHVEYKWTIILRQHCKLDRLEIQTNLKLRIILRLKLKPYCDLDDVVVYTILKFRTSLCCRVLELRL